jgi:hypothetical protein
MPGLVPGIHVFFEPHQGVDGRESQAMTALNRGQNLRDPSLLSMANRAFQRPRKSPFRALKNSRKIPFIQELDGPYFVLGAHSFSWHKLRFKGAFFAT